MSGTHAGMHVLLVWVTITKHWYRSNQMRWRKDPHVITLWVTQFITSCGTSIWNHSPRIRHTLMSSVWLKQRNACTSTAPICHTLQIADAEIEYTNYNNIESTNEVGPDPVTCNALATVTMNHAREEFPELLTEENPTELAPLWYTTGIMQYGIDVIPTSCWSPPFTRTHNQFKDQVIGKIKTELETGRVVHSRCSNTIGMFSQPKRDVQHDATFLL